jgi:hypothetical protein
MPIRLGVPPEIVLVTLGGSNPAVASTSVGEANGSRERAL